MLLPQAIIARKRDGHELSDAEIGAFVRGLVDGSFGEAQVAALAMAILLNGMSRRETVALTLAMRDSGRVLDWSDLPGPTVDKHSTGGIGDKVSLVLAPLLAAAGAFVPMISGRGLGHTGGTLDKLDSIEGYRTQVDVDDMRRAVRVAGCAIVGQTGELAPADGRLYAIRDISGTVESLPLITASILSKKLAAGPAALVMDVKVGSGAFLPGMEEARELVRTIVDVARGAGLPARALLTDMNQCLGRTCGNALEVREAIALLRGEPSDPRLVEAVLALAAEALALCGLVGDRTEGRARCKALLASGEAALRFARMCEALGGPASIIDRPEDHLAEAPVRRAVPAPGDGHVAAIDGKALGHAVIALGGGRRQVEDPVDHAVGLSDVAALGEPVARGAPLAVIHARDEETARSVAPAVLGAFRLGDGRAEGGESPVVLEIVD